MRSASGPSDWVTERRKASSFGFATSDMATVNAADDYDATGLEKLDHS
jgi:hypothetical protein